MPALPALSAAKNLIKGSIPDALRNLKALKKLSLSSNLMHGTLPEWLGELRALTSLSLAGLQGEAHKSHPVELVLSRPAPSQVAGDPEMTAMSRQPDGNQLV